MKLTAQCVLNNKEIIKQCEGKKIAVYGAGNDGRLFLETFGSTLEVVFYIDQQKQEFCDKKVYSLEEAVQNGMTKNVIIIIASRRYQEELAQNLEKLNLVGGKEFYIWDGNSNEDLHRYIDLYKKIWKEYKVEEPENEILIPYECVHDGASVVYSYCANYLAKQNNARICAHIRRAGSRFEAPKNRQFLDIYYSFNVDELIEISLPSALEQRAQGLYEEIVERVQTTEDWNHIWIDGVDYGNSIVRDYLRRYPLGFEPLNDGYKECLQDAIRIILFWRHYFENHSVKYVFLWDGVHNDSYIRDIAIAKNIPVYILHCTACEKALTNHNEGQALPYLKSFYERLDDSEKKIGIEWAKKTVKQIHEGINTDKIPGEISSLPSIFGCQVKHLELGEKGALKVLICPHIFNEDSCHYGGLIFGNYIAWLQFLGEMSEKTEYEWYIKLHPHYETERGHNFIREYTKKYPKIKLLPADISPYSLKEAGIRYAFTVCGSIGHEYPLLGIDVINAGNNPHISFGFNINPNNKEELEEIIMNLPEKSMLSNAEEIYSFYCAYYIYYSRTPYYMLEKLFRLKDWYVIYPNEEGMSEREKNANRFLDIWSEEFHEDIIKNLPFLFETMEEYTNYITNKNPEEIIKERLNNGVSFI